MREHGRFDAEASVFDSDIAIIGMAGRFPGAPDIDTFWRNLRDGVESVIRFSDAELSAAGVSKQMLRDPDYVKAGAPLSDMEMFDASFFGLTPREAAIMDPQHRVFLECAWQAIEDAGYDVTRLPGPVGVFGGSGHNAYLPLNLLTNPDLVRSTGLFMLRHTGNDKDFLTTRLSYLLDLKGPSVAVQTACSTSLVAIHLACQSLLALECDMALAGGVTIELPHRHGYLHEPGGVTSPDGHCRPFDRAASGTVFGSGAGVVMLRRLSDALASGDHIYALIRGSAINNDGSGKVGYFAPSVNGQAHAIIEAMTIADVAPDTISYVEAHGTGTFVGDPIEVAALTQAFRTGTDKANFCAIGSLKGNIGHLDTAAGVAGVIKVAMALQEGQLPPSINFDEPNAECRFDDSPFSVVRELRPWVGGTAAPRRAGVSSLGVGGTNAHVILEQAPVRPPAQTSPGPHLLVLSAATATALEAGTRALGAHLSAHPDLDLGSVAYTLQLGRKTLPYRRSIVVEDREDAIAILAAGENKRIHSHHAPTGERTVAFMFAGGGAQHPNMGRDLYWSQAVFRDAVEQCFDLLEDDGGAEIRAALYPPPGKETTAAAALERPSLGLPALFITQYAQARLLSAWGVEPDAMIGHSMGEYVAAHLAGVFSLRDALRLVRFRGHLFEQVPPGAMLSVPLDPQSLAPFLTADLSIAAINGTSATVVSGSRESVAAAQARLAENDTPASLLRISVAAHSAMLEPQLAPFAVFLETIAFRPPTRPFISSLTGTWITADAAQSPAYWVRHLRETVRFHDGLAQVLADRDRVLLEVGPGRVLTGHALQHPGRDAGQPVIHASRHVDDTASDVSHMLDALGRLWAAGVTIDFASLHAADKPRRVPLPTYCFDRLRHWIEPGRGAIAAPETDPGHRSDDIGEWFYRPTWTKAQAAEPRTGRRRVLVFADRHGLGERLAAYCEARGDTVVVVRPGRGFAVRRNGTYVIRPNAPEDMARLIATVAASGGMPDTIYHLWSVTGGAPRNAIASLDRIEALGFYSLLHLGQTIGAEGDGGAIALVVVSDGMQRVCGERDRAPAKATLLGPCRVIPRELPNVRTVSVDIDLPPRRSVTETRLVQALLAEPFAEDCAETVALRHGERWVQRFEVIVPRQTGEGEVGLKPGGVYVITGGLGEIALAIASHLAITARARIALIGRRVLPARAHWPGIAADPANDSSDTRIIRQILEIEQAGGTVLILPADVADVGAMRRAIRSVRAAFGPIDGVFHAAGLLDDQLVQLKDDSAAARVLAPKVRGTLALQAALRGERPDFVMLFSSVSASLGAAGQVDYAAANAFLDAFAQASAADGGNTIAVDWSQWRDIGMAAALARAMPRAASGPLPDGAMRPAHPWLDACLRDTPAERRYTTRFAARQCWLLDEHRTSSGAALIPGTGFLEIARAAVLEGRDRPTEPLEIKDVLFLEPFFVDDAHDRDLTIRLQRDPNDTWRFELSSLSASGTEIKHVRGRLGHATCVQPDRLVLGALRTRCGDTAAIAPSSHMRFGSRWSNLAEIRIGEGEALLTLSLPAAFAGDLNAMAIHPALLDMATAGAQMICPGLDPARDFFVPASYGRLRLYGPMAADMFSHVRLLRHASGADVASYDVTLCDARGLILAEVSEFTMIRVRDQTMMQPTFAPSVADHRAARTADASMREDAYATGIQPHEGLAVIDYLLAHPLGPQVAVAPQNFIATLARARTPSRLSRRQESRDRFEPDQPEHAMTATERMIADMWRDMLGVDRIGPADTFFDLGGHSLLAVQFVNKLRKRVGLPVPATALIETPTLAALAARFAPEGDAPVDGTGVDAPASEQGAAAVLLRQGGAAIPLFLVHDGLGEILLYRTLAQRLDGARHVYGLAPTVAADGSVLHTQIRTMAAAHIEKMRAVQPSGPYLLAGLCAGGVIAFEMARQLEDAGDAAWYVGIIDAADVAARERPFLVARLRFRRFIAALKAARRSGLREVGKEAFGRAGRLVRYELTERARRRGARLAVHYLREAAAELPQALAEPARATVSFLDIYKVAHREHRPNGLLQRGHVVLYRASKGNDAPDDMPFFEQFSDCALGWGARVMEPIDILPVPGGHVSALQEPHVAVLAQAVQDGIDRAIVRGEAQTSSERRDARPDRALPALVEDMVRC